MLSSTNDAHLTTDAASTRDLPDLQYKDLSAADFVFTDKPAGVTTHSSLNSNEKNSAFSSREDGWVEYLNAGFFVVHRLDRDTSGALCFAKTKIAAQFLAEKFAARDVAKTYLFITDKPTRETKFISESFIERRGNRIMSDAASATPNSKTSFHLLKRSADFSLWEAKPESGRPHQIRLHAAEAGLAILGDSLYGGGKFPALCLHSKSISFAIDAGLLSSQAPEPRWFSDLTLLKDIKLCRWLAAIDRRERLLRTTGLLKAESSTEVGGDDQTMTFRLIHNEGEPLRVEKLGEVVILNWYAEQLPSGNDAASLERLIAEMGWKRWLVQLRANRGQNPNQALVKTSESEPPKRWVATELGLKYEMRLDSGLSQGLFLDQRRNRKWVLQNSSNLKVLNLFSYTGGFSVCAAKGGAKQTVSVDLSKVFLDWSKRNFELNAVDISAHEFRAIDSRTYLQWAAKKNLSFELIVCDPPSFGRSNDGVFRIEKDFKNLLESLWKVASPGGRILFSSNYEQWSLEDFIERARKWSEESRRRAQFLPTPFAEWDFELPRQQPLMKSFFIVKAP